MFAVTTIDLDAAEKPEVIVLQAFVTQTAAFDYARKAAVPLYVIKLAKVGEPPQRLRSV